MRHPKRWLFLFAIGVAVIGWRQTRVYHDVPKPGLTVNFGQYYPGCPNAGFGLSTEGTIIGLPVQVSVTCLEKTTWLSPIQQCRLTLLEEAETILRLQQRGSVAQGGQRDHIVDLSALGCGVAHSIPSTGDTEIWAIGGCGAIVGIYEGEILTFQGEPIEKFGSDVPPYSPSDCNAETLDRYLNAAPVGTDAPNWPIRQSRHEL